VNTRPAKASRNCTWPARDTATGTSEPASVSRLWDSCRNEFRITSRHRPLAPMNSSWRVVDGPDLQACRAPSSKFYAALRTGSTIRTSNKSYGDRGWNLRRLDHIRGWAWPYRFRPKTVPNPRPRYSTPQT
jgi:hypothetical protein